MSSQNHDDLIPRAPPRPTPIEIVSIQPEVPEPSLLFDQCSKNLKSTFENVPENLKYSLNDNIIDRNYLFDQNDREVHRRPEKSPEVYNRPQTIPTCSSSFHKQMLSHQTPKTVSFSPRIDKYFCNLSPTQFRNGFDCNKRLYLPETVSCRCSHETENNYPEYSCKVRHFKYDYNHSIGNEIYNVKRCLCANCNKQYNDESPSNFPSEEQKSNMISSDELQKTVLKFENLFLKLNYKYSKITENFVSKEELNIITQKYDAQIDSMKKYIEELNQQRFAKLNEKCEPIVNIMEENQQLKRLYNDIVLEVKQMLEKNRIINADNNVDPVQFIKKATSEQFRRMGFNVENINEEEKKTPRVNELQSKPVTTVNSLPKPVTTVNSLPSSDFSLHMNASAMKYTLENQSDSNQPMEKKSSSNDISVNYNNISIATLQYLERYQLLSGTDKDGLNKYENDPLDRRHKLYERVQNNDKSFIY